MVHLVRCWKLPLITALLGLPSAAAASGFLLPTLGGEPGHPTTSRPVSLYYNPAGIALESGTRFYVEGLIGYHRATYDRPAAAIDNPLAPGGRNPGWFSGGQSEWIGCRFDEICRLAELRLTSRNC